VTSLPAKVSLHLRHITRLCPPKHNDRTIQIQTDSFQNSFAKTYIILNTLKMKKQIMYFSAVGFVGFLIDAGGVFLLMRLTDLSPVLARIPSFACALLVMFALNRKFTFAEALDPNIIKAFGKYLSANALSQALNFSIYTTLVLTFALLHEHPILAVSIASTSVMSLTFLLSKYWVFRY